MVIHCLRTAHHDSHNPVYYKYYNPKLLNNQSKKTSKKSGHATNSLHIPPIQTAPPVRLSVEAGVGFPSRLTLNNPFWAPGILQWESPNPPRAVYHQGTCAWTEALPAAWRFHPIQIMGSKCTDKKHPWFRNIQLPSMGRTVYWPTFGFKFMVHDNLR